MNISLIVIGVCAAIMKHYPPSDIDIVNCQLYIAECVTVNRSQYQTEVELVRECSRMASSKFEVIDEYCIQGEGYAIKKGKQ